MTCPDGGRAPVTSAAGVPAAPLFRPFSCRGLRLRNRIVMAPMTREAAPGGLPTPEMAAYYAARAAGGAGLILTEGSPPCDAGAFSDRVPAFHDRAALPGWRAIVEAVQARGAAIFLQLWHVGAFDPSLIGMQDAATPRRRLGPSGLAAPGRPFGAAMGEADIAATLESYAGAAARARALGFDGVEVHAAHGYLPDQFFWAGTNRRRDRYGGDIGARSRFAAELVAGIKARAGADFPVSLRISQWKQLDYAARLAHNPQELAAWLEPLVEAGVDLFHVSTRRFWDPGFDGSPLTLAGWVRRLTARPVIAVGSVTLGNDFKSGQGKIAAPAAPEQIALLSQALERGEFDLIAVGRAMLANPDWADKVRAGDLAGLAGFSRGHLDRLV